jgi:hypothetical protein
MSKHIVAYFPHSGQLFLQKTGGILGENQVYWGNRTDMETGWNGGMER